MRSRKPRFVVILALCVLVLAQVWWTGRRSWSWSWRGREWSAEPPDMAEAGPYGADRFEVAVTNPETGNSIPTVVWFPASGTKIDNRGAPYPGLVFAHGAFASPSLYSGNGAQLATWGYVVALPHFSDERLSARVSDSRRLFTYFEEETRSPASRLHNMVDPGRLGIVGHSLGGHTALAVAGRDERVKAVVALDPGNPPSFPSFPLWDAKKEGAALTAPTLVIGAAAHTCNLYANYDGLFPLLGATHRATLVVTGGSHCDSMLTSDTGVRDACFRMCRGEYSAEPVALTGHYTVAWFNYYLRGDPGFYAHLYGSAALDDAEAGLVTRVIGTAPRAVDATVEHGAIVLSWEPYAHAVVDGYNIYRRAEGRHYAGRATARVLAVSSYVDTDVLPGTMYYYTVRSRDAAGNEHEPSREVSAVVVPE